jgi:hypothetical protein
MPRDATPVNTRLRQIPQTGQLNGEVISKLVSSVSAAAQPSSSVVPGIRCSTATSMGRPGSGTVGLQAFDRDLKSVRVPDVRLDVDGTLRRN